MRRRALTAVALFAATAAVALALAAGRHRAGDGERAAAGEVAAPARRSPAEPVVGPVAESVAESVAEPVVEPAPRHVRDVTPGNVLPAPAIIGETIVRLPSIAPRPPPPRPEPVLWPRAQVLSAGLLRSRGVEIAIAGVEAPAAEDTCPAGAGRRWPCGNFARAALQRLVRGRTVECDPAGGGAQIVATCRVAGRDIGEWLVAQGWALPSGSERYGGALVEARQARRGRWGRD